MKNLKKYEYFKNQLTDNQLIENKPCQKNITLIAAYLSEK
jgi:hypothetical protein